MIIIFLLFALVVSCKRAFFGIPVTGIPSRNKYPTHIVISYHQNSPQCKELWQEWEQLQSVASKYVGRPSYLSRAVSINQQDGCAEYEFAGAISEFLNEARMTNPNVSGKALVKGSMNTISSFPAGIYFDFGSIQLDNDPNGITTCTPAELRIMTYNVHLLKKRVDYPNEAMDAAFKTLPSIVKGVIAEIQRHSPDVLLLQEVPSDKFGSGDQKILGAQLAQQGFVYKYCQPASYYLDNCIYSKHQLGNQQSTVLETNPNGSSKRGIVTAEISVNGQTITLAATHVNKFNQRALDTFLNTLTGGVLVGADFNVDLHVNPNWVAGYTSVHLMSPFASGYPMTAADNANFTDGSAVDYILMSPALRNVASLKGPVQFGRFISDHLSVIVSLCIFK